MNNVSDSQNLVSPPDMGLSTKDLLNGSLNDQDNTYLSWPSPKSGYRKRSKDVFDTKIAIKCHR